MQQGPAVQQEPAEQQVPEVQLAVAVELAAADLGTVDLGTGLEDLACQERSTANRLQQ